MCFLLKKIFSFLLSLFLVSSLTFFLMKILPGDPFSSDLAVPDTISESLLSHHGLDKPYLEQYLAYMSGLLHGQLGSSLLYEGRSVEGIIQHAFPISAFLGLQALMLAIPAGIFLGSLGALHPGKKGDLIALSLSAAGISVPSFVLATLLQYFFAIKYPLFPIALWGSFSHTVLPTIALAAMPMAAIARLTRGNLIEVLSLDYIKTAKAKGLLPSVVLLRHGLKNGLVPVIAYLGPVTAHILTGSFVIEKIFAIPGIGQWLIQSILARDYPIILGLTLFYSFVLLLFVFLADMSLALLDPRLKKEVRHVEE